jgi:8-oxo-dGTP pyrophosphatase MutT (NUDIX family)
VYENPWLRFEAHEMVHPNGHPGEYGVVVTPVASAVVVLDGDEVVLTRQSRYAVDRVVLEVVKGGAAAGELPLACAQREVREEIGLVAARWDALGVAFEIPSIVQEPVWLFLARDLSRVPVALEDVETIEAVRMPFARALEGVSGGEIDDAVTAMALVRAARLIGAKGWGP